MKRRLGLSSREDTFLCKRKKRNFSFFLILFAGILLFTVSGCFWFSKKEASNSVRLILSGSKNLNQDDLGSSLPLLVRLYQIKGKDRFENADFLSVWKSDRSILEEDFLDRQELTVFPGKESEMTIPLKKDSGFLAVMALFRKPDGTKWRQIIPLKNPDVETIEIQIGEKSVDLIKIK